MQQNSLTASTLNKAYLQFTKGKIYTTVKPELHYLLRPERQAMYTLDKPILLGYSCHFSMTIILYQIHRGVPSER